MSKPEFASEMACAHCDCPIALTLRSFEGRRDYWLTDGEQVSCLSCGGSSTTCIDEDNGAYFDTCEDASCAFCPTS